MHQHPLTVRRRPRSAAAASLRRGVAGWQAVPQRALVAFTRSFAVMVGARLTLLQALDTAADQCRNERLRQALEEVRRDVRCGRSLSESFGAHPAVFDPLFVHLARIGEAAGVLDQVLLRLARYLEKSAALRRKVRAAMAYPALVLCVAVGATAFLLTAVVPTFAEMYADFGAQLPAPTRVILRVSRAVTAYGAAAGVGVAGLGVAFVAWRQSAAGRYAWARLLLGLPVLGALLRKNAVAQFCRTLGTLLESGVPLVEALDLLARASGNRVVAREVERLVGRVRAGSSLTRPLQRGRLFPPMVVQMIAAGEQTAELDRMLRHAADFYEQEVDAAVDGLTAAIEPALIVLVGVLLGGILMAMYLPMFELINVVG